MSATLEETIAKRKKRRALYERDVKDWTLDELIEVLLDRYSPDPIPACRLCGAELSVQAMGSASPTVYACDGREPNPDRPEHMRWKEGRTPADEHYVRSQYEDCKRGGDEDVLEAVRRLQELDKKSRNPPGGTILVGPAVVLEPEVVAALSTSKSNE